MELLELSSLLSYHAGLFDEGIPMCELIRHVFGKLFWGLGGPSFKAELVQ
jgi:hypothetical protein